MSADTIGFDRTDIAGSPTIKVEIYDQAYTVRSDGDPDYLKQLAEYVDQRMREISSGTLTVDSRKVAILAVGLGIAYTLASEWGNVEVRRAWAYTPAMPRLPWIGTGLSPLAQWLLVPSLAFLLLQRRRP